MIGFSGKLRGLGEATGRDLGFVGIEPSASNLYSWRKGKGCPKCFHSGYMGREAIEELLDMDSKVREIICDGTMTQLYCYLRESNFISFGVTAQKVKTGVTTLEEVLRVLPHTTLSKR